MDSTATFPKRHTEIIMPQKAPLIESSSELRLFKRQRITRPSIPNEEASGYESIDLDNTSTIDLKKRFPVSRWLVVKEMFPWLAGFTALFILYSWSFDTSTGAQNQLASKVSFTSKYQEFFVVDQLILYGTAIFVLTIVGIYYELQRYFFQYRIEGFRIILRKGIILRDEGSLPLLPIAEVFSRRGVLDFILGLYQVNIAVPVNSINSFACIDGLNKKNASLLIDFISAQLSRQVSVNEPTKNLASR